MMKNKIYDISPWNNQFLKSITLNYEDGTNETIKDISIYVCDGKITCNDTSWGVLNWLDSENSYIKYHHGTNEKVKIEYFSNIGVWND
jgi:hypothetical protein